MGANLNGCDPLLRVVDEQLGQQVEACLAQWVAKDLNSIKICWFFFQHLLNLVLDFKTYNPERKIYY